MNLLERIRATAESIPTSEESSSTNDDLFLLTCEAGPEIHLGQQKYELPNRKLFLAIYESALRNPRFFCLQSFQEYKKWLLEDSCYVLNTFKSVDADALLACYLKWLPPNSVGALYPLASLLWDIDLCVPEEYQRDFEQIIIDEGDRRQKKNLTKN